MIELYVERWRSLIQVVEAGADRLDWPRSRGGVLGILWANDIRPRRRSWGNRNKHLPQRLVAGMVVAYEDGATVGQIAERYGRDPATVSEHLRNAGVRKRHRSPNIHLKPQVLELRGKGRSWASIGRELGISPDTARRLAHGRER